MRTWFTKLTANASLSVGNPELFGVACAAQFAFETARATNWGVDPDDAAQDAAVHALLKQRSGGSFGHDARTRVYMKQAVYWMATRQWRKTKRAKAWSDAQTETHTELVAQALSPEVARVLGTLSSANRELLMRAAVNEEPLMDLGEERARVEAAAAALDWDVLTSTEQAERVYKAYFTLHKRFSRMCVALRPRLA